MRRTTISHFSFRISNSIEAFISNQGAARPMGLPFPPIKKPQPKLRFFDGGQMK